MNYTTIFFAHKISVILFLLIYLVKTILLLSNQKNALVRVTNVIRIPEMIISFLFLITGVYMITQLPEIKTLLIIKIVFVLASIPLAVVGFKKSNKLLASLSLFLIIMAYGFAEMSKKPSQKNTEVAISNDGNILYSSYCANCHGEDGTLGLAGAANLSITSLNKESIYDVIKNGKGAMPGMGGTLTEEQIKSVSEYITTLKK